ncbi:MAG: 3-phosphoshikimate 1-carboxyvinyltransferase [Flavobacteriaceae bacterium]|nr:3-phosphoshikimate 1-carboxyvinyltransferase [Flavobacteriaceae bacterium]|tara:strand:+ start:501 stop:1727 length:1227 start_codon:yes stop_codon:yes gene_type:complete
MSFLISHSNNEIKTSFNISGSKSESNRLLILKHLFNDLEIKNLSDSDDTLVLQEGLSKDSGSVNVHHAGTAMRFLTAYFSTQENKYYEILGSSRMHERPIKILVDALNSLGADIKYLGKKGYPPLKINGKKINKFEVSLNANISSQYITALILIGPSLDKGLSINLLGKITSKPYIEMSIALLQRIGVNATFINNRIEIKPIKNKKTCIYNVESDWSSLSYFFSIVALSKKSNLEIGTYFSDSIQGDKKLIEIYNKLGVKTFFKNNIINLKKDENFNLPQSLELRLNDTPDLAQTIAVSCFGLGLPCDLHGLHTLKIKETDRLLALKIELEKLGAEVKITPNSLHLKKSNQIKKNIKINTYSDHRMAMAFAPLGIISPIIINDPDVISKSFPSFWRLIRKLNFKVTEY